MLSHSISYKIFLIKINISILICFFTCVEEVIRIQYSPTNLRKYFF